jgi:hypothetical protein
MRADQDNLGWLYPVTAYWACHNEVEAHGVSRPKCHAIVMPILLLPLGQIGIEVRCDFTIIYGLSNNDSPSGKRIDQLAGVIPRSLRCLPPQPGNEIGAPVCRR